MKSKQVKFWGISAWGMFGLLSIFILTTSDFKYREFGTTDFIEYWSASKLASYGSNPYDFKEMLVIQRTEDPTLDAPIMMWNPPHILLLISPLIGADFSKSARTFCIVNLLAFWALAGLVTKLTGPPLAVRSSIITLALTFPATLFCLQIGQPGIILGLSFLFGISLYLRGHRFLAGCIFVLCSIKPHLFLAVLIIIILNDISKRRFELITGGILTIAALIVLTELQFPGIYVNWIDALQHPERFSGYNILGWRTATFVGLFRVIYWKTTGLGMPLTPLWLFPLINLTFWIFLMSRIGADRLLNEYLPEILIFSSLFASYGWTFDQTFLLYPWAWAYVIISQHLFPRKILLGTLIFIGSMASTYLIILVLGLVSEWYVLLNLPILAAVFTARTILRSRSNPDQKIAV